jgi:outer membrane DcaP-like protein
MAETHKAARGFMVWLLVAAAILIVTAFAPAGVLAQGETPKVEVYGFVQADYIQDFNRVDPAWQDTLRPSKIPTADGQFGQDGQASFSAKQSRFGVMMNLPTSNMPVFTKFEFDMFGVGVDAGQTTIRLRHAYGQWGRWLGGQTNSLFMDASIFPNVIDYWGPAGMVFLRTPQIRYTVHKKGDTSFDVAIEKPSNDVDGGTLREIDPALAGVTGTQKVPDLTGQYRSGQKWGHFQVAGILRKVAFETLGTPNNEPNGSETGWGIDGTAGIKVGKKKDQVLAGIVYGHGIASYMNDGGVDLAPDPSAKAVPLLGFSAYFDHYWSDKYSSSFGVSETQVDNTSLQAGGAFHRGQYVSANLLYYPTKNVFIGGEALWGQRKDNDGATGDDTRIQISYHYSFSTKDIFKKNPEEQH